jgi:hypothetical protein
MARAGRFAHCRPKNRSYSAGKRWWVRLHEKGGKRFRERQALKAGHP